MSNISIAVGLDKSHCVAINILFGYPSLTIALQRTGAPNTWTADLVARKIEELGPSLTFGGASHPRRPLQSNGSCRYRSHNVLCMKFMKTERNINGRLFSKFLLAIPHSTID